MVVCSLIVARRRGAESVLTETRSVSKREINFAKVTDESLFKEVEEPRHVSAFQELAESRDDDSLRSDDEVSRSRRTSFIGIRDSLDVVRAHASKVLRQSASVLSLKLDKPPRGLGWVRAEEGLIQLQEDDTRALAELLEGE